jgi:acyl-CoA hydrolase
LTTFCAISAPPKFLTAAPHFFENDRKSFGRRGQLPRQLYDFIDDNPRFEFLPIDQVCHPREVSNQSRMVSITQAFAIDLTGQICIDQFEGEFYGGVSTQAGFMRGAARSQGGKPIVCLSSTTDDGASRIKPLLEVGDGVGIARSDVHYVITEYGIAYLFGKSIRERALALIEVAHPRWREELLKAAKKIGICSRRPISRLPGRLFR